MAQTVVFTPASCFSFSLSNAPRRPSRIARTRNANMEAVAQFCYIQEFLRDDCTDLNRVERKSPATHSDTGTMFNSQSWMKDHTLVEILSRETTTQPSRQTCDMVEAQLPQLQILFTTSPMVLVAILLPVKDPTPHGPRTAWGTSKPITSRLVNKAPQTTSEQYELAIIGTILRYPWTRFSVERCGRCGSRLTSQPITAVHSI